MYNMDNKDMISTFDKDTWKILIPKYLNREIKCPDSRVDMINKYKGEELDRDGEVYCGVKGIGHKVIDYWGNWIPSKDNLHGSLSGK